MGRPAAGGREAWLAGVAPEWTFLALGAVFGALLVVVSPPLYWGDENTHFLQSYRLAVRSFALAPGADRKMTVALPRGVPRLELLLGLDRLQQQREDGRVSLRRVLDKLDTGDDREEPRPVEVASANYPLLGYAPQALGIAVARLLTRSVLLQLYAARLANLAVWLVLIVTAIRTSPAFKTALAVLALSPMSVFVASTCSADALNNAVAFLWVAWIVRTALAPVVHRATMPVLFVLAVALTLVKLLYGPLVLLVLAVPAVRLGGERRRLLLSCALIATAAACALGWTLASQVEIASGVAHRGIAAFEANRVQLRTAPVRVLWMVASTVLLRGEVSWIFHVTDAMWGVVAPPTMLWVWLAAVASAVLADERSDAWPSPGARALALVAAFGCLSAIALVAFLFWTPAHADSIAGFQGRYAIAVLPALLLALCPPSGLGLAPAARSRLRALSFVLAASLLAWTVVRGIRLYG